MIILLLIIIIIALIMTTGVLAAQKPLHAGNRLLVHGAGRRLAWPIRALSKRPRPGDQKTTSYWGKCVSQKLFFCSAHHLRRTFSPSLFWSSTVDKYLSYVCRGRRDDLRKISRTVLQSLTS